MKRILGLLLLAAMTITACTDQPVEAEPMPTTTVTETVTAEPGGGLPAEDEVVEAIGDILELSDTSHLSQGAAALDELTSMFVPAEADSARTAEETASCPAVFETQPEIAGYGATEDNETEDQAETTSLAALGFATPDEATELTDQIQGFIESCDAADYEIETLTHHTDEAFEIQLVDSEDATTSVVLVRNLNWVFAAASTPAGDVALALTLVDQLDETLR